VIEEKVKDIEIGSVCKVGFKDFLVSTETGKIYGIANHNLKI
jgi:hypothetical protein